MFNTLAYTKKLEAVGVIREQAETHVQIIAEIVEADLATKTDIKELREGSKNDIKELKDEFIKLEYRLIIKLTSVMVVLLTTTLAVIGAFYKFI